MSINDLHNYVRHLESLSAKLLLMHNNIFTLIILQSSIHLPMSLQVASLTSF